MPKAKQRTVSYTRYGDFSPDGLEFVIHRPDTPRPWINFLSNEEYGVCLSQTGGGYSFILDPGWARITRWEPANWLRNTPGRFLYLRDEEKGEWWSAHHQPVNKSDAFECRHGLGYTILKSSYQGIQTTSTHFVPRQGLREVWLMSIKNQSRRVRRLSLFPMIEWHLGEWEQELKMRNLLVLLNVGQYDSEHEILLGNKNPVCNRVWPWTAYMASSLPVKSFDLSYEKFMGRYGGYHNPQALTQTKLSNTQVLGGNMVGAFQHRVTLKPGQELEWAVVIGAEQDASRIPGVVQEHRNMKKVHALLDEVKKSWHDLIVDNFAVQTPDQRFNKFVNVWNKYQVVMNNHWGRGVSFYHEGWGEFGYRNTAQDAMGMLLLNPEYARQRLMMLARNQRKSGQPLPGWSLITGINSGNPPSDFPMWLPLLLMRYVKETGEKGILDEVVEYFDGGSDTLYQHAVKATRFLQDVAKSERGLPLMGTQDWNDAFDRAGIQGRGESVWLAMGLCFALQNLQELAAFKKDSALVQECSERYAREKGLINQLAWDGEWYWYGTNDAGEPIGSKRSSEGSIQLNSQTWAIIAGIAEGERLDSILRIIEKKLDTPYGPVLFAPPYKKYDGQVGRITSFAPGTKENAAIFCHGGAFKVYADIKLRRGEAAYETFQHLMPCAANKDIETYKTEPYVFAEYLVGPENPNFGEGAHTWLTGTADWTLFCALEGILGIRPEFEGLAIDPCIPKGWKKFKIKKKFRQAVYHIEITNPEGVETGVRSIRVDGQILKGNVIPPHHDGKDHIIQVVMGRTKNEK